MPSTATLFRWTIRSLAVVALLMLAGAVGQNFLNALNRSRQKRTMATVRDWGLALEESAGQHSGVRATAGTNEREALLLSHVKIPRVDGWGRPLVFAVADGRYSIVSRGRDGEADGEIAPRITNVDCDIIYSDGYFVSVPEGM